MIDRWQNWLGSWTMPLGLDIFSGVAGGMLILILVWSLAWKGLALWHAARRGQKKWFIPLLVINTAGILEILYLYVFSAKKKDVK